MATLLLTWEFASGLGHMAELKPVIAGLAARGHRVVVALKNLAPAGKVFADVDVNFLPARVISGRVRGSNPAGLRVLQPAGFNAAVRHGGGGFAFNTLLRQC